MDTGNQLEGINKELNWQQRRLERIQKYIDENLSTDLSAAFVSEKFSISTSTLRHNFKKYLLQGYQQYVEKIRMKKAMEMTKSGKKIREIMFSTGYKNSATFYDAFRRTFKHPPGRFKYDWENDT
jgi:two-component system response regulator YesN